MFLWFYLKNKRVSERGREDLLHKLYFVMPLMITFSSIQSQFLPPSLPRSNLNFTIFFFLSFIHSFPLMSAATATAAKKEMKICSPCSLETCILHYILNFFALFILPMFILSIITSINYFTQIKEQKRARERESESEREGKGFPST
jgi:phosphatidylglycerophosphate synthase